MKTIFKYAYIFLGAALLMLSSCEETLHEDLSQIVFSKEKKTIFIISVDKTSVDLPLSGKPSETISVTSNDSWTVSKSDTWITPSKITGSGNETFTIEASENTSSQRTGTVSVTGTNSGKSVTIYVTQVGVTYDISVTPTTVDFGSGKSSQAISVTSNDSWTVSTNESWITLSQTSGSNNSSFTITVFANTGAQRSGTVTVKGTNSGQSVTINVTQAKASDISRDDFSGDKSLD